MKISQYPFNAEAPRQLVVAEKGTVAEVRETLERLAARAEQHRRLTRRELTPPVQSEEERGQGDSTNARLHRALYGRKLKAVKINGK